MGPSPLERFSPATRAWFESSFPAPTTSQEGAWAAIAAGDNVLVIAPTGSGKTLAAFLSATDRLVTEPVPERGKRLRVLYVSPLKALAVDIERNLRSPLTGIRASAQRLGLGRPDVRVAIRTGDTSQEERRRFASDLSDILITTPESLFLLLTSRARDALAYVDTVIVDEVHAIAGTKRGSHLALSLERLDAGLARPAQRIGLSATVRPPEEIARFLGGVHPVTVVAPPSDKEFDLSVVVPVEDMTAFGEPTGNTVGPSAAGVEQRTSVWPHVEERLLELIRAHRSTIVFANSRRLSERLCARLNELAEEEIVRAHHGSVSREQRLQIEEDLKVGRLPAVVATSSLELGIDMGAVDLVVQVEAPDSVASGLQRIGRAGHQVGAVSRGVIFPKFRGDLLECAVVVERMRAGAIEEMSYPRNPLDVLAQQIVAMVAMDDWKLDELEDVVKRAAPFHDLPRSGLESVLDMLSGRYPSDEFAELRPRLNWDRATDILSGRPNAQRLAVTSGGTIPDRGLFGVFLAGDKGARVGELDEEMVYESRPGETFILGASTWLIEDITHDRVIVTPAPGLAGKMPFWHGDAPGRPIELGRAMGAYLRTLQTAPEANRVARLKDAGLDDFAATNLVAYLEDQKRATGALPDDRTIVIERFQDELGDWRVCIHSMFGARVHAPWSQAIEARLRERLGLEVQCIYTDDGIVMRIPEADEAPLAESALIDPEDVEDLVVTQVGNSALFASRFRECAGRALLLPKRRPGGRTPLWQQRQKSAHLLQVAGRHGSFPIMIETFRECLQDVFDVPALVDLMGAIQRREVRIVEVDTPQPSPFASSLQFGFVSAFMYEGDAPIAERRAQALALDRSLLAEIMGHEELRELIDPIALDELELELQLLTPERALRNADDLHDGLRLLGDLTRDEIAARARPGAGIEAWIEDLAAARRILPVRIAGDERFIAVEDAARYRDGLGVALPVGVPDAFLEAVDEPVAELIARYARRRGPFDPIAVAQRFGLGRSVAEGTLRQLAATGRVAEGEFRPGRTGREWVDTEVLRRLRRKSLARFRKEVEPAPHDALARLHVAWHDVALSGRAPRAALMDDLLRVLEQLQGVPLVASTLEQQILPARLAGYQGALLDQLGASGEIVWCGAGALGTNDGWLVLALADRAPLLLPEPQPVELSPAAVAIRAALEAGGALFFRQIADATGSTDDTELLLALWELVWAGHATNDTLAPLRALGVPAGRRRHTPRGRRGVAFPSRLGPPAAAGRWSLVTRGEVDPTRRAHALAEQMLARYGIVTRGSVVAERSPGGFAAVYQVLKAMEEAGRCKRGYFVEGLGGAQFAISGAVDRMRSLVERSERDARAHVLAATDPANPYGAALPWPESDASHRPGRKAGAVVVLVDGRLALYVEKGGRSLLSFTKSEDDVVAAVDALAGAARSGFLGRLSVERADGGGVFEDTAIARALVEAGFRQTSRGLKLRA